HRLAARRAGDEAPFDLRLVEPGRVAVRAADRDHLGVGPRVLEQTAADEVVMHDDVGGRETALTSQRQQPRVAGARPHQVDATAHRYSSLTLISILRSRSSADQ